MLLHRVLVTSYSYVSLQTIVSECRDVPSGPLEMPVGDWLRLGLPTSNPGPESHYNLNTRNVP